MSNASSTFPEIRDALNSRFVTEWAGRTPYCLDNEEMPNPAGQVWVRFAVRHLAAGPSTLGSVGNRKFRREAAAMLQIFQKPGAGTALVDDLVPYAQALFEGRTVPGTSISFKEVFPRELGLVDEDRWWALILQANFAYDEVK